MIQLDKKKAKKLFVLQVYNIVMYIDDLIHLLFMLLDFVQSIREDSAPDLPQPIISIICNVSSHLP